MRILATPGQYVPFTNHGERVDDQESSYFRNFSRASEATNQLFDTHRQFFSQLVYPDPRVQQKRVETNLRKDFATFTERLLALVELARYWHARKGDRPSRLIIVSPDTSLFSDLSPLSDDPSVEFLCPLGRRQSLLLRVGRALLVCAVQMMRRRHDRQSLQPCVATPFVWGIVKTNRLNDLFWWWDSKIPADRVLLFFDRADLPATRAVVNQAESLGMRCVALSPDAAGGMSHLQWRPAPGLSASVRRLWRQIKVSVWGFRQGKVGRWTACRLLDMLQRSARVEDFLTEFNVGCLFHYQEWSTDYFSLGCDATGTTRAGVQWSYFPWAAAGAARLNQAYFVWGPHALDVYQESGSSADHVLMSGCLVSGAHPVNLSEGERRNRHAITDLNGATRVLALFDTSLPCEGFYEFFLSKVIQDSRWGLLIKPKYAKLPWDQSHLSYLQDLYQEALATGRVQPLDWQISPAEAAAAADFSVGVDINTAVVIAALAGHRAIHLDYVRLHESPMSHWAKLYKAGPDRLVFDDPERLWERLNQFFDEPGSYPDLGIADEELLRQIDPFRDGKACERIGEYVRWYLEGLDGGLDWDRALAAADLQYADRWGAHTVIRGATGRY